MDAKQIRSYIKTLKFGLKDFEKTNAKYSNYKTEKRKELDVSIDVENIVNNGICNIFNSYNSYARDCFSRANTKSIIRQCKTMVNNYVYDAIKKHISRYTDDTLNDNEIRSFATRVYLEHYEKFNEEMLAQLEDCICGTE